MNSYRKGLSNWRDAARFFYRAAVLTGDLSAVGLAYILGYAVRFHSETFLHFFPIIKGIPPLSDYFEAGPVVLLAWALAFSWVGAYERLNYGALDEALRVFRGGVLGSILAMSAMFLYRESSFSRLVFLVGGGLGILFTYAFRECIKIAYLFWVRRNRRPMRVLILGNGYLSASLKKILDRQGDRAVLQVNTQDNDAIKRTIARSRIHEVLVANPQFDHKRAIFLANYCEEMGVDFRLLPDILEVRMGEVVIDESLGVPTFRLKPLSLHGSSFFIKRLMDIGLASLFLIVFSIPMLAIALLIKLTSPGPVFYRQARLGYREKSFDFLKFRTMVQNADDLLEDLKRKSERGGPVFKMKRDPRITILGRFLRRFSIDELPQLFNVIRGEMSLVGPRPQVIWETENYDEWAKKRLNVLPGITGLWQVSGRAELTYQEMIDLDVYYIEHWSPGLDIKIMLKTIPAVLGGKGAY